MDGCGSPAAPLLGTWKWKPLRPSPSDNNMSRRAGGESLRVSSTTPPLLTTTPSRARAGRGEWAVGKPNDQHGACPKKNEPDQAVLGGPGNARSRLPQSQKLSQDLCSLARLSHLQLPPACNARIGYRTDGPRPPPSSSIGRQME